MGERGDRGDEAGGPTGGVGGAGGGGGGAGGFNTAVICESWCWPDLVWICREGVGLQSESGTLCTMAVVIEGFHFSDIPHPYTRNRKGHTC